MLGGMAWDSRRGFVLVSEYHSGQLRRLVIDWAAGSEAT